MNAQVCKECDGYGKYACGPQHRDDCKTCQGTGKFTFAAVSNPILNDRVKEVMEAQTTIDNSAQEHRRGSGGMKKLYDFSVDELADELRLRMRQGEMDYLTLSYGDEIILKGPSTSKSSWRTGKKLGRTIYKNDELQGMMDCPDVAERIVELLNKDSQ